MSNHSQGGWARSGFATNDAVSLTTSYAATGIASDATVSRAVALPDNALMVGVLFEVSANTGGAASVITFYLARDSAGTKPISNLYSVNIVKALNVSTATTGGCYQAMDVPYRSQSPVGAGSSSENTVYLIARVDAGTATAQADLMWRA